MTNLKLPHNTDRIVREPERKKITGISRTLTWTLEKKGLHPKRRKLTPHGTSIGWLLSELLEWVETRRVL